MKIGLIISGKTFYCLSFSKYSMSWIDQINEEKATGKLKIIYQEIEKKRGKLSNVMRIHSLNPDAMQKHMDLYISIMFAGSPLKREERELIAVVVSSINQCSYCIQHHAEAVHHYWKDNDRLTKILEDFHHADLSKNVIAMLEYVEKLTKIPNEIRKSDIDNLKRMGFSDKTILDINLITSYFNFVNRIILGLGVEFSDDEVKGYKY